MISERCALPSDAIFTNGISAGAFDPSVSSSAGARLAQAAGFGVYEPVLTAEGSLTIHSDESGCRALGDELRAAGVSIDTLDARILAISPLTASSATARARACELVVAALDRARWLGARTLIITTGGVAAWDAPRASVRYEDALHYAQLALHALSYEAEARHVMLAIANGFDRFLMSPVEMRALIDHVNSGWVRVCLNTGASLAFGYPQDWIDTLGSRIVAIHASDYRLAAGTPSGLCLPGDGDVEWPAVVAALRRMHFDGPVICTGPGEPAELAQRLDRVLAG